MTPLKRALLLASAVSMMVGTAGTPAAQCSSPLTLYRALLRARAPESQLPRGFHDLLIGSSTPMGNAPKHGAIGEVDLVLNSATAVISYIVFPNRAAALADYRDTLRSIPNGSPASGLLPKPAIIYRARRDIQTTFVDRNVEISVLTPRQSRTLDLAVFAARHLEQTERATG